MMNSAGQPGMTGMQR